MIFIKHESVSPEIWYSESYSNAARHSARCSHKNRAGFLRLFASGLAPDVSKSDRRLREGMPEVDEASPTASTRIHPCALVHDITV